MDEYSGKRSVGGLVIPGKGSGRVLRDATESRDRNAQFCNRLGCNGRLKHTKSVQNGCSEKFRSSRPSFHASSSKEIIGSSTRTSKEIIGSSTRTSKEIIGSSTRTCSAVANTRKSFQESRKKLSSQLEIDSSEASSVQNELEVSDAVPSTGRIQIGVQSALNDAESGKVRLMEVGSSSIASNIRPGNVFRQKSGMGIRDTPLGSSIPLASKSTCPEARNSASASRYGLRNLRCNSISDVVHSGCSSSESNLTRRKEIVKKRCPEVKSSSAVRGKKMSGPLSEDGCSSTSTHGISISDSRQTRNWSPSGNNGVGSVRTRRSINGNTRTRLSNQGNGNNLLPTELPVVTQQVPQPELPIALDVPNSSHQFSAEASSSHSTSFSDPGSSDGSFPGMPFCPTELGMTRSLMNRDGLRRYNMVGIAEVLLALERIEQDEELTYEQLHALETNLFLGGLGFYDQHRDMRLDIDSMSYEELLALEEKMGNVSTALSEEALSKCLKRSIYQPTSLEEGTIGCSGNEDDVKCSICQEEYLIGDEVGRLECKHGYHAVCIQQWLQLKNWCPICKASAEAAAQEAAAPSRSFSSSPSSS